MIRQTLLSIALVIAPASVCAQATPVQPKVGAGVGAAPGAQVRSFSLSRTSVMRREVIRVEGIGAGEIQAIRVGEWEASITYRQAGFVSFEVPDAPAEAHVVTLKLPSGEVTARQRLQIKADPVDEGGAPPRRPLPSKSDPTGSHR